MENIRRLRRHAAGLQDPAARPDDRSPPVVRLSTSRSSRRPNGEPPRPPSRPRHHRGAARHGAAGGDRRLLRTPRLGPGLLRGATGELNGSTKDGSPASAPRTSKLDRYLVGACAAVFVLADQATDRPPLGGASANRQSRTTRTSPTTYWAASSGTSATGGRFWNDRPGPQGRVRGRRGGSSRPMPTGGQPRDRHLHHGVARDGLA